MRVQKCSQKTEIELQFASAKNEPNKMKRTIDISKPNLAQVMILRSLMNCRTVTSVGAAPTVRDGHRAR